MKKIYMVSTAVFVFLILAGAGCVKNQENFISSENNTKDDENLLVSENLVVVDVKGTNFAFEPSEIKVKLGDRVRVNFINAGGFHDFVIDEFNARTAQIKDGASETIEFVADKQGTFEFYCSVGKHREMGMKGNLIVE